MSDFVAIDFETANSRRGSPCQVGLVRVRDDVVVDQRCWYVQPPAKASCFDPFNIRLHGITADMVADAPPWREVVGDVMSFVQDDLVVAHNAGFDIGVLRAACELDQIEVPNLNFLCTLTLARQVLSLPSYRLPFVAADLGVSLVDHHDALADAQAAAGIAIALTTRSEAQSLLDCARSYKMRPGLLTPGSYRGSGVSRPSGGGAALVAGQPTPEADVDGYLYGRVVVFTGTLPSMTRQEAWEAVTQLGGIPEESTTKRTHVLVIGDIDPRQLAPGAELTSKAKRAFELQRKGQQIEVMTGADFLQVLPAGSS